MFKWPPTIAINYSGDCASKFVRQNRSILTNQSCFGQTRVHMSYGLVFPGVRAERLKKVDFDSF